MDAISASQDTSITAPQAPSDALSSLSLNNATKEKQNGFYQSQPSPAIAPPPAYPSPAPTLPTTLSQASALYQYNPTDAGDLALMPNDQIAVTEYMNAEWWKGRNLRTGQEGIFPRSYVQVSDEKGSVGSYAAPAQSTNYGNLPLEVSQSGSNPQGPKQPSQGAEMGKKFGKKLGNATIFGAGATMGSKIVHGIF